MARLPNSDRALVPLSRLTDYLRDRPDLGLVQGWVGTLLSKLTPGVWEVEFADGQGRTIATAPLPANDFLILQMDPALA